MKFEDILGKRIYITRDSEKDTTNTSTGTSEQLKGYEGVVTAIDKERDKFFLEVASESFLGVWVDISLAKEIWILK